MHWSWLSMYNHESMCFFQRIALSLCLLFVSVRLNKAYLCNSDKPTIQYLATRNTLYGQLEDFDINSGDWNEYGRPCTEKRAILLTTMGPQSYSLLRKLCSPKKPSEKTYAELCTLLGTSKSKTICYCVQI